MRLARCLAPLLLVALLAACDSPTEKAEAHYQRALAYLAEGDAGRATVEFRNVFRLNGDHVAARLRYAQLLRDQGNSREAMAQYLRLDEQAPTLAAGQRDLAGLALETQDIETATIHVSRAFALDPKDPETRAIKATVDYRKGTDRPAAVAMAEGVLADAPASVLAHLVLIADRLAAKDMDGALARAEAGLAAAPDDQSLHLARLALLEEKGDTAAVGAELAGLNRLYPDDESIRAALVRWHLASGQTAEAEAVLRAAAADPANTDAGPALTLAQFLLEVKGADAARAELEARAAAAADPKPFRRALAGLDFSQGHAPEAIAAMRQLLDGAPATDDTRGLQVGLAEMLDATGDTTGAASLLATVLGEDQTHLAALKLRARMAIVADRPDAAVQDMRTALAVAPRDPEVMTIMAFAHERAGDRGLMGERLALAVEMSNRAPTESLRYASFLMQENRPGPAEGVVVDALRRAPENRELLGMLGRIHLARRDWDRAGQVAAILRDQGDPAATAMAASLDSQRLAGAGQPQAALPLLEELAGTGGDTAMADLVRARVAAGDTAGAEAYLDSVLAGDPASRPARTLKAGLLQISGQPADAEALYRAVIADAPVEPGPHLALFGLLAGTGQPEAAAAALDAGIAATPDNGRLLFTRAGLREAGGDFAGAATDYETLYARDSADEVVANNLASLLSARGGDPAALDRAFAIADGCAAATCRSSSDTYGWILLQRGAAAEALTYLAPAAAALSDNAQVQFHHAEAERALGNRDAAATAFRAALAAAEAGSPLPQVDAARTRLAELEAAPATPAPTPTRDGGG